MSTEKQPKAPVTDLPKPNVDDNAAEKVKGGAQPVNDRPKPAEPISERKKI